mmetsp:Transcript_49682/g.106482  ORF Transcript_49682/g.106482 Transcript_49682/m.106482 type:complete len:305 (+) Transcript_49682:124-1038(+)
MIFRGVHACSPHTNLPWSKPMPHCRYRASCSTRRAPRSFVNWLCVCHSRSPSASPPGPPGHHLPPVFAVQIKHNLHHPFLTTSDDPMQSLALVVRARNHSLPTSGRIGGRGVQGPPHFFINDDLEGLLVLPHGEVVGVSSDSVDLGIPCHRAQAPTVEVAGDVVDVSGLVHTRILPDQRAYVWRGRCDRDLCIHHTELDLHHLLRRASHTKVLSALGIVRAPDANGCIRRLRLRRVNDLRPIPVAQETELLFTLSSNPESDLVKPRLFLAADHLMHAASYPRSRDTVLVLVVSGDDCIRHLRAP